MSTDNSLNNALENLGEVIKERREAEKEAVPVQPSTVEPDNDPQIEAE